jgi:hypothetical protein
MNNTLEDIQKHIENKYSRFLNSEPSFQLGDSGDLYFSLSYKEKFYKPPERKYDMFPDFFCYRIRFYIKDYKHEEYKNIDNLIEKYLNVSVRNNMELE